MASSGDYEVAFLPNRVSAEMSSTPSRLSRSPRSEDDLDMEGWYYYPLPRAWYRNIYKPAKPHVFVRPCTQGETGALLATKVTKSLEEFEHDHQHGSRLLQVDGTAPVVDHLAVQERAQPRNDEMKRWHRLVMIGSTPLKAKTLEAREQSSIWILYFVSALYLIDAMLYLSILANCALSMVPFPITRHPNWTKVDHRLPLTDLLILGLFIICELCSRYGPLVKKLHLRYNLIYTNPILLRIRNFMCFLTMFCGVLRSQSIRGLDLLLGLLIVASDGQVRNLRELVTTEVGLQYIRLDEEF